MTAVPAPPPAPAPSRWRVRATAIEAVQWTGINLAEVINLTGPVNFDRLSDEDRANCDDPEATAQLFANARSRWALVKDGDWIIKGVTGLLFAVTDGKFREDYEPVTEAAPAPEAATPPVAPGSTPLKAAIWYAVTHAIRHADQPSDGKLEALVNDALKIADAERDALAARLAEAEAGRDHLLAEDERLVHERDKARDALGKILHGLSSGEGRPLTDDDVIALCREGGAPDAG